MCGIVGFVGKHQAAPVLLEGLSKLEYRGYDSAGIAVRDGKNMAEVVKAVGRLKNLEEKMKAAQVGSPAEIRAKIKEFDGFVKIAVQQEYDYKEATEAMVEALDGVEAAAADHTAGKVELTLSKEVAEAELKKAVEGAGYEFVGKA